MALTWTAGSPSYSSTLVRIGAASHTEVTRRRLSAWRRWSHKRDAAASERREVPQPGRATPADSKGCGGSDGRRSRDLTIFSRALYQLSYRAWLRKRPLLERRSRIASATLTGLEPATSAVTGRHANQLRYRAKLMKLCVMRDPNGIRTRAAAVKGRCPRPLNDGARARAHSNRGSSIRAAGRNRQSAGCVETAE